MTVHEIRMDRTKPLAAQAERGHNRWHPDIPAVLRVAPGDEVVVDTVDAADAQLSPESTAADLAQANLNRVHPLTGQDFDQPFLALWRLADGYAVSPDLPGVRIAADPFLGTFGVAPSRALLGEITAREQALLAAGGPVMPPEPADALPADPVIAAEGLRTMPPRENAGNVDIPQTGVGARLLLPVWTAGALFSAGDGHFAQGEGEACGTAIEMTGTWRLRFDLRKREAAERGLRRMRFERPLADPSRGGIGPFFATTGISVDREGVNHGEDVTVATRDALYQMINHLEAEYGYSPRQAYALCSVAVQLRISALPDISNASVTALLPLDIFE